MSDTTFTTTFISDRLRSKDRTQPTRRNTHGGCAWSLPSRTDGLRQPQDGALSNSAVRPIDGQPSHTETEDIRLTGGLRSLARRVRGLNVVGHVVKLSAPPAVESYFAEPQKNATAADLSARKRPETLSVQRPLVA